MNSVINLIQVNILVILNEQVILKLYPEIHTQNQIIDT